MTVIAELTGVSFRYPHQSYQLLRRVDLKLNEGEVVVVAGANGSGKSTILNLLAGKLQPLEGSVRLFGHKPTERSRIPDLGMVVEPFHPEFSPFPVKMCLKEIVTWLEVLDDIPMASSYEWGRHLGLNEELFSFPLASLSKGERQRAVLTTVFAREPKLILADEPLEGLDSKSKIIIGQSLHAFAKKSKGAVLWISHNLAESLPYADRFFELADGKLVEHDQDRYCIRFSEKENGRESMSMASLHSLPGILAEKMSTKRTVVVEIEDRTFRAGEEDCKT